MIRFILTRRFKIIFFFTVTLIAAQLFVIVQPAQATETTITDTVTDTHQRLDGDDTLVIEEGGELNMGANVGDDAANKGTDDAVRMTGNNNRVINRGKITTTTSRADAILSLGANARITNIGTITVKGEGQKGDSQKETHGINVQGANSVIINSGTIEANGQRGKGIWVKDAADGSIINNSGTISATGDSGFGIGIDSADATIINSGTISTTGKSSKGIYIWDLADNVRVTNSGTIETTGEEADGIYIEGDNSIITNNGMILTTGKNSDGIYIDARNNSFGNTGYNNIINNNGLIRVTGEGARGIWVDSVAGRTNTINNYGLVSATGAATHAIQGGAGDETLTLFSGSQIIGRIDLGGGIDTVNVSLGRSISTTMTLEGAESINFNGTGVVAGNVVTSVDPTGQSVKGPVLNSLCTGLHEAINRRLDHFKPALIKLATTRIEPGMLVKPKQPQVWGGGFRSYRKRDKHGRLFAYDHEYRGFTFGLERTYKRVRAGVMGGFSRANVEADSESFRTDSNSYFTGVYGQYDLGRMKMQGSLIGGYEDHDNSRMVIDNLSGFQSARADFGSIFLSPSVTLRADYTVAHRLLLRPSATVVYSAGWYDEYHEHGTTRSNLTIDDRTLQALNGNVRLAAIYMITDTCKLELSAAGTARYTDDRSVDGNLGGSDFRFAATNDDSVYGGQLGAYLGAQVSDHLNLYVNGQFARRSGDETQDYFMAGLQFKF